MVDMRGIFFSKWSLNKELTYNRKMYVFANYFNKSYTKRQEIIEGKRINH